MKKERAIETLGGGTQAGLAKALRIHRCNVTRMPDELPLDRSDQIRGAMVRLGRKIPPDMRERGRS